MPFEKQHRKILQRTGRVVCRNTLVSTYVSKHFTKHFKVVEFSQKFREMDASIHKLKVRKQVHRE